MWSSWPDDPLPVGLRSLPAFLVYAGGVATIFACGRSVNFSTFYALMALFFLMADFRSARRRGNSDGGARRRAKSNADPSE